MRTSKKQKREEIFNFLENDLGDLKIYLEFALNDLILDENDWPLDNDKINLEAIKSIMQAKKSLESIEELQSILRINYEK